MARKPKQLIRSFSYSINGKEVTKEEAIEYIKNKQAQKKDERNFKNDREKAHKPMARAGSPERNRYFTAEISAINL